MSEGKFKEQPAAIHIAHRFSGPEGGIQLAVHQVCCGQLLFQLGDVDLPILYQRPLMQMRGGCMLSKPGSTICSHRACCAGSYGNAFGLTQCLDCPAGSTTTILGAIREGVALGSLWLHGCLAYAELWTEPRAPSGMCIKKSIIGSTPGGKGKDSSGAAIPEASMAIAALKQIWKVGR